MRTTPRGPLILGLVLSLAASLPAQTVYIPSGTSGIGTSSNGNVGIGTSSPAAKLDVVGGANFSGSVNAAAYIYTGPPIPPAGTTYPNHPIALRNWYQDSLFFAFERPELPADYVLQFNDSNSYTNNWRLTRMGAELLGGAPTWSVLGKSGQTTDIFHVGIYSTGTTYFAVTASGGIGIGTVSPAFKLHTVGVIAADQGGNTYATMGLDPGASASPTTYGGLYFDGSKNLRLEALSGGVAWRNIVLQGQGSGNVGIGTTNPTQKLSVNGTIQAKEVIVQTGWSDYVFEESYQLSALSEVAQYIKREKHLPGIPSAQEVAEHGVSMGEMQSKLLAKIEELTLHQIAQEKQLAAQAARIGQLEADNATLRNHR